MSIPHADSRVQIYNMNSFCLFFCGVGCYLLFVLVQLIYELFAWQAILQTLEFEISLGSAIGGEFTPKPSVGFSVMGENRTTSVKTRFSFHP